MTLKQRTRRKATAAIASGRLVRQPCEVCGSRKVHAHHEDYAKPLKVRWLCEGHHKQAHNPSFRPGLETALLEWLSNAPETFATYQVVQHFDWKWERQCIEYWLNKWRRARVHVRKSGSKPGVWLRRTPKE